MDSIEHAHPEPERIERSVLQELMVKRDAPGLLRLGVQMGLFWSSGIVAVAMASDGSALTWPAIVMCGLVLATFFAPEHEAGHGTAFETPWLNTAASWWCSVVMLQAPSFFREFHWQHHRKTQDPDEDPEISAAPVLLDDWPRNPIVYLALASGQLLWVGKLMFTLLCAILPRAATKTWERAFPWLRERKRRRIAWESRLVILLLGSFVAGGLCFVPGFWALLLAWVVAHVVLGLYLMAEHTGLPNDGTQAHRTRTVKSNAVVRWLMWNMPYHAEHHIYPAVPFHAVPRVNARIAEQLEHTSSGYIAFHLEALRHAFGLHRRP